MGELETLSSINIERYAKSIGTEYRLLRGDLFKKGLVPQCQSLFMLDESFDGYDTVVMLDMDTFTRAGMDENIFEHDGVGGHSPVHDELAAMLSCRHPRVGNIEYSYWGGSVYKMDRVLRQRLRANINDVNSGDLTIFNGCWQDEGIMHALAVLAKVKGRYFSSNKWHMSSYSAEVADSYIIHIRLGRSRTLRLADGDDVPRSKIRNYQKMVDLGFIRCG